MTASRIVEGVLFQRLHQQAFKHQATSLELLQVLNCQPYLALNEVAIFDQQDFPSRTRSWMLPDPRHLGLSTMRKLFICSLLW